jgi:putative ABC transport system ATP-binding protein
MSSSAPAVQTVDVTKTYRVGHIDYPALRGVSLKVGKGELVSIVGPSGSGKSTLLNVVGALDPPTSGRVIIDGIELRKLNEDKLALLRNLKIGYVYQTFNLIQRLTAVENVEMPLIARGISERDRRNRSLKMLTAVGLSRFADKRPRELSGGEQQRVAIARALVTRPTVILADEPTGNLDSKTAREVVGHIVEVNRAFGTTVFVVTHNRDIAAMTHRMIALKDGLIERDEELARIDSYTE